MLIKQQSSWSFEDRLSPTPGRMIKEVIDLYTDEQMVHIKLKDFLRLNIKRSDNNENLPFIGTQKPSISKGESEFIYFAVNLGDLNSYPKVEGTLRHVKLEIEYLNIYPGFWKKSYKLGRNPTGYISTTRIDGPSQHEYLIKLPLGMKLDQKELSPELIYVLPQETGRLQLNINYLEKVDGNEVVHLLINEDDYEEKYEIIRNPEVIFYLSYSVSNQPEYIILFPVLATMMLAFVFILFIPVLNQFLSGNTAPLGLIEFFNILIPQTIVLFPFTYYYIDSSRRNFEIPFSIYTELVIMLAIIFLVMNLLLLSATYLKPFSGV
ncbi:MAG TPA: hypothetical protein VMC48_03020 [Methanobacterium sp.]|nr:hypothetical protein [Methanobacterium sp.]